MFCGSVACLLASPSTSPAFLGSAVLLSPGSIPGVHALLLVARFLDSVGVGSFPLFSLFRLGLVLLYAPHLLLFLRIVDVDRLAEKRACSLSLSLPSKGGFLPGFLFWMWRSVFCICCFSKIIFGLTRIFHFFACLASVTILAWALLRLDFCDSWGSVVPL